MTALIDVRTCDNAVIEDCEFITGDRLLISVKNTFSETLIFVDGLPQAKEIGHGLGTQNIRYVVEKLGGNYQFSIMDDMFVLQVIP